jgi:hypothetical protein
LDQRGTKEQVIGERYIESSFRTTVRTIKSGRTKLGGNVARIAYMFLVRKQEGT